MSSSPSFARLERCAIDERQECDNCGAACCALINNRTRYRTKFRP